MKDVLDFEDYYSLYGYEPAIRFLISQAEDEIKASVDLSIVLVRFHNKASRLRRLEESDRRLNAKKRKRAKDDKAKKKKSQD